MKALQFTIIQFDSVSLHGTRRQTCRCYQTLTCETCTSIALSETWWRHIMETHLDCAHEITKLIKHRDYTNVKTRLLTVPMKRSTAVILQHLTDTESRRRIFVDDCIDAIPQETKIAFGKRVWTASCARKAGNKSTLDFTKDNGVYGIFLDSFYAGKTSRTFEIRWAEHLKELRRLVKKYESPLPSHIQSENQTPRSISKLYIEAALQDIDRPWTTFPIAILTPFHSRPYLAAAMETFLESCACVFFDSVENETYLRCGAQSSEQWRTQCRPDDMPTVRP